MMRMSYLVPRMIILGLLALALLASKDTLIKRVVVNNLESAIGAKVEIGKLRSNLRDQKLFVKELAITNPNDPMVNLFQADMAYLDLDYDSLLHRRVVINNSQTSNVVFGAPRLSSGALENSQPAEAALLQWRPRPAPSIQDIGLSWLDKLPPVDTNLNTNTQLAISQVASQYAGFWQKALEEQSNQIAALELDTSNLKAMAAKEATFPNPLRKTVKNPYIAYNQVSDQSAAIETRMSELHQVLAANRLALHNAYQQDLQLIRTPQSQASKFDSQSINQLLLTESENQHVGEIIGWFHWFRQALPDAKEDFQPRAQRGINLKIPSRVRKPGFLIRSIDLEGDGRFANQHTSFAGTAYNLSNEPQLHDEPASFTLRAQGEGDNHVMLNCVLDRRGENPIDTLNIVCPALDLKSQLLGDDNSLLVTMGPQSKLQAEINIQAIDNQLSGEITFRHSNVSLHVDKLNELAGGKDTALQLNQGLASLDRFTTKITLSGTIENYQYVLKSDLGDQFAKAVDAVLSDSEKKQFAKQKQMVDGLLNSELQKLDNQIAQELETLSKKLNSKTVEIADIRNDITRDQQKRRLTPVEGNQPRPVFR